ncbi:sporulation integral membrane protein YtvI [Haloimpatiens sp. FM7330]|uniref:sporulation integral membrane protein YtvI n=1 Tax=Haloimpatiens sp. FM7330 TaxID=3298610 RepID=UPI0036324230
MDTLIKKMDKLVLFLVIYTAVFLIFFSTLSYTLPFVLALLFAIILQKPTKLLISKFKLKDWVASLIVTIIFFTIIISLLLLGITSLSSEIIDLGKNIQSYITNNLENIKNLFDKLQNNYNHLDSSLVNAIETNFSSYASKTLNTTVAITSKVISTFIAFISRIPYIIMVILFTLLSTYFFTKDLSNTKNKVLNLVSKNHSDRFFNIITESKKMLSNYLLSYLVIIFITFIETLIGFLIFKIKYAVILSVLCGIFDLLPILGIGTIYIPVAIICFISKNYVAAIGITILYAIVSIIRQIIEPKIVSSSLGLHPVAVLAAIFIGLKANGLFGMLFCVFLVVFYNILKKVEVI